MKTCSGCGETKQLAEFSKCKRDGYQYQCKACRAAYRVANAASNAATIREWREANVEKIAATNRAYYAARPEVGWANKYRWRAKKYGFVPVEEEFNRVDVIERYGDGCVHCDGGAFEQLDHWPTAVALGGHHTLNNVRPSCAACNQQQNGTIQVARRTNQYTEIALGLVLQGLTAQQEVAA